MRPGACQADFSVEEADGGGAEMDEGAAIEKGCRRSRIPGGTGQAKHSKKKKHKPQALEVLQLPKSKPEFGCWSRE